jgi:A/G-specific adenine glycosylase
MAAADLDDLRDALLRWYPGARRDLPWRRTTDPYAILVSEVMLQQTQVARVVPRWLEWLERWPDAAALAAASRAEVLAAWVGLGYNRRAVALHAAAAVVAARGWPEDLTTLPGVGPYTAAAVGSFAFGAQVAAVDVNIARVASRIGREVDSLLPRGRADTFNHAMMDLGATICTARRPRCDACPVAAGCASAGVAVATPPRRSARERFEDSDRFARGRIVAALASGEGLPAGLDEARTERALAGLVRDGLVVRDGDAVRLP